MIANQPIDIKFTLTTFYGSIVVWEEEHAGCSTNANGIVVTSIGERTRLSGTETSFDDINFLRKYRLTVKVNINSAGYQTLSTSTLKYVPQAKYAKTAGSVDFNYIYNLPANLDTDNTDDVTKLDDLLDAKATTTSTFIGVSARQNNTESYNIGIGKDALKTNTTSVGNTALGSETLKMNTGEYNTAVGVRALNKNTSGNNNTSLGALSMYANVEVYGNTSGNDNVAVGKNALINNLVGTNNVALGTYAGNNSIPIVTMFFLGKQAGRDETGDNKLYIANSNTATPLIYGDFASSELTINGDLAITQNIVGKIKAAGSGNADMKAYVYGTLVESSADISIVPNASSAGFTVSKISTGKYEVSFTETSILTNDYTVVATSYASSNPELITYVKSGHAFIIHA